MSRPIPMLTRNLARIARLLLLGCALVTACASTKDLSSAPPAPWVEDAQPVPLDYDPAESHQLASWLRANGGEDLAYRMPVRASNVRGQSARFSPSALTDGDGATYWTTDESVTSASVTVEFGASATFDHVVLQEHVELGRRVAEWSLSVRRGDDWAELAHGSAIGEERTLSFEKTEGEALRLTIEGAHACPVIDSIEVFAAPGS